MPLTSSHSPMCMRLRGEPQQCSQRNEAGERRRNEQNYQQRQRVNDTGDGRLCAGADVGRRAGNGAGGGNPAHQPGLRCSRPPGKSAPNDAKAAHRNRDRWPMHGFRVFKQERQPLDELAGHRGAL
jgi:hypothetical protein